MFPQYKCVKPTFCGQTKLHSFRVRILARILAKCKFKKQLARWYFLYLHFLASGNLGLLSMVLNLDINLLSSFLKCCSLKVNVFCFYPSENPANGGSLHCIQPQWADAYDKLPSMVGSQPIICFLILDCSKYSQMGSSLVFSRSKIRRNLFL